jgi:hypothetical protein
MIELGRVVQLQVQTGPLKLGPRRERYNPGNLVPVSRLEITARGVVGWQDDLMITDVHHQDHPEAGPHKGNNLSFNFTSHYKQMRGRFGDHLINGCGGENIIFAAATLLTWAELQGELVLETEEGECGRVINLRAASPCAAFAYFALNHPTPTPPQLKASLRFLGGGQRGYYADWQGEPLFINLGDRLLRFP